jgi:hypothetical protein
LGRTQLESENEGLRATTETRRQQARAAILAMKEYSTVMSKASQSFSQSEPQAASSSN